MSDVEIDEISGGTFEAVMRELGYPAWYRDDQITKAIDAAWEECREAGRTIFEIAAAARRIGLPPMPEGQWH